MTHWSIYWLTRLEALRELAVAFCVIGGGAFSILVAVGAVMRSEGEEAGVKLHRFARWVWPAPVLGALILTFVPTLKEAAAIIVIPQLAASEDVRGIGTDLVGLARAWLEELKPDEK